MRFIHTADWHLGRLFHGTQLIDDQRYALRGLVELAQTRRVEAVVIAGDVFDRGVPPTEAVDLLDEIVATLALEMRVQVVMIAGNHDSATRLQYLSGLARMAGVHVVGRVGSCPRPALVVGGDGTRVNFWPLAYTDPETARYELGCDDIRTHEAVIRRQLECIEVDPSDVDANVLVGHAFVAGCRESESERALSVGGSGMVPASLFKHFDYVALGHLHESQIAGASHIRYAGSLLKYSFEEAEHTKSFTIVSIVPGRPPVIEQEPVRFRRDVRRVRGRFDDLIAAVPVTGVTDLLGGALWESEAYVEVVLTDPDPILDPVNRLRLVYPHLLSVRREAVERAYAGPGGGGSAVKSRSTLELFTEFYADVKGRDLTEAQMKELVAALAEAEKQESEAPA
jgi:exonuclease SbcD